MGMTNRVIPAQGEERGASFTLIRLDGDASRKFQPSNSNFSGNFYNRYLGSVRPPTLVIGRILPETAPICMFFLGLGSAPAATAAFRQGLAGRHRSTLDGPFELVRFVPVAADTYIDFEGHRQCRRPRHVGP